MTCICANIPAARRGEARDAAGKLLYAFHVDCEEHGVVSSEIWPMKSVTKTNWVTAQEAIQRVGFYRAKEGLRIVSRSPDHSQALLEWIEWEPMEEKEIAEWKAKSTT